MKNIEDYYKDFIEDYIKNEKTDTKESFSSVFVSIKNGIPFSISTSIDNKSNKIKFNGVYKDFSFKKEYEYNKNKDIKEYENKFIEEMKEIYKNKNIASKEKREKKYLYNHFTKEKFLIGAELDNSSFKYVNSNKEPQIGDVVELYFIKYKTNKIDIILNSDITMKGYYLNNANKLDDYLIYLVKPSNELKNEDLPFYNDYVIKEF